MQDLHASDPVVSATLSINTKSSNQDSDSSSNLPKLSSLYPGRVGEIIIRFAFYFLYGI